MRTLTRVQSGSPTRRIGPLAIVLASTVVMWALSSVALLMYTAGAREPVTRELQIPFGAAEQIADGANPLELPATWSYYAGDVLVLDNRDVVAHRIGPWVVSAGTVLPIELQPTLTGFFACSLHPDGEVTVDVAPRGYDWRQLLLPTLLLGPAVGLVIAGSREIMLRLDDGGDPEAKTLNTSPTRDVFQGRDTETEGYDHDE